VIREPEWDKAACTNKGSRPLLALNMGLTQKYYDCSFTDDRIQLALLRSPIKASVLNHFGDVGRLDVVGLREVVDGSCNSKNSALGSRV
jgi:hypothetical protein